MKALELTIPVTQPIPNSYRFVQGLRKLINCVNDRIQKHNQRAAERALANAVVEQHYQDMKLKALEMTLGIRSDNRRGM